MILIFSSYTVDVAQGIYQSLILRLGFSLDWEPQPSYKNHCLSGSVQALSKVILISEAELSLSNFRECATATPCFFTEEKTYRVTSYISKKSHKLFSDTTSILSCNIRWLPRGNQSPRNRCEDSIRAKHRHVLISQAPVASDSPSELTSDASAQGSYTGSERSPALQDRPEQLGIRPKCVLSKWTPWNHVTLYEFRTRSPNIRTIGLQSIFYHYQS